MKQNVGRYWLHLLHIYFKFYYKIIAELEIDITCWCQIAIFNTNLSIQNFKAAMAVPGALGLDPTIANSGKLIYHSLLDVYSHLLETIPH